MTDEQKQALKSLEKALSGLAHTASGLSNLASGRTGVSIADKPTRPDRPARFADLVEASLALDDSVVREALAEFRAAFAPGLRLVEDEQAG